MKTWSDTAMVRLFLIVIALSGLVGCDPFEKEHAEYAESQRIQCLDKICPGDIEPRHDMANEVAFKLNGQWYIGPKVYGDPNFGSMRFYWPSKAAGGDPIAAEKAPEIKKNSVGAVSNFSEVAIEIFLRTKTGPSVASSMYQLLMQKQAKGEVIAKNKLRNGLEAWDTRSGTIEKIWYVATDIKEQNTGDPPVVGCLKNDSPEYSCTMGFRWRPDVSMDMRFSAKHGPDWPEIYQETTRVLQLLKKV